MSTPRSLLLAARMMMSKQAAWIHALGISATADMFKKPLEQCDALAAYRAEMDEAGMRAARAVVEAIGGWPCGADHDLDRWDDARLRAVIEKARRENE